MTPEQAAVRIRKKRKRCVPALILLAACILGIPYLAQKAAKIVREAPEAPTIDARKKELVLGMYFLAGASASFIAIPLLIGLFTPTKEELTLLAYYDDKEKDGA